MFIFCYSVSDITVTVQNSFGSRMTASTWSNRTIEQDNTTSTVSSLSATRTSSSLNVFWNAPNNVCGSLIGYSVYVNSMKVQMLCLNCGTHHLCIQISSVSCNVIAKVNFIYIGESDTPIYLCRNV